MASFKMAIEKRRREERGKRREELYTLLSRLVRARREREKVGKRSRTREEVFETETITNGFYWL